MCACVRGKNEIFARRSHTPSHIPTFPFPSHLPRICQGGRRETGTPGSDRVELYTTHHYSCSDNYVHISLIIFQFSRFLRRFSVNSSTVVISNSSRRWETDLFNVLASIVQTNQTIIIWEMWRILVKCKYSDWNELCKEEHRKWRNGNMERWRQGGWRLIWWISFRLVHVRAWMREDTQILGMADMGSQFSSRRCVYKYKHPHIQPV